nr:unnamed protein product [Spirometra erinaceieuropaei]
MHSQWPVPATSVHKLLFAEECVLNVTSEEDMQRSMDIVVVAAAVAACNNFGLVISPDKTVIMHQPPPDAAYAAPQINVNGNQLQVVDNLTYLGNTLSRNTKINDEVARRISKTSLRRLQIDPSNWKDLPRDPPTSRRAVKTGAAISEANCITAAKAERETRKSQLPLPAQRQQSTAPDLPTMPADIQGSN